jgi:hypothetical protein
MWRQGYGTTIGTVPAEKNEIPTIEKENKL